MTDLSHLKETYSEMRREMKRGYGVHSFDRQVEKKRIADVSILVDKMKCLSNGYFNLAIRIELSDIIEHKFTISSKSSLKAALNFATINQFIQLEKVIRREGQTSQSTN